MRVKWNTHIYKNCKLNNSNQNDRKCNGTKYQRNDHKDCHNGNRTDHFKIGVRNGDQILGTRCLTDQHAVFIISRYNVVDLIDLGIYLIGCCLVFGTDQNHLIFIIFQNISNGLWNHILRNRRSDNTVDSDGSFDSIYLIDTLQHFLCILCLHMTVCQ